MKKSKIFLLLILSSCYLVKEEIRLGTRWERIDKEGLSFPIRRNFGTAVIDGKIIVVGGYIQRGFREELANDVWISEDQGQSWSRIKENTDSPTETFTKRQKFGLLVMEKDIYIIGGYSDTGSHLNDIWKSDDLGKTWKEVVKNANFTPRYGHKATAVDSTMYVVGGYDGRKYFNEIWKSVDFGLTWEEKRNVPFRARQGLGLIDYKDEILMIGGQNQDIITDLWRSEEQGLVWFKQPNIPFEFFEQEIVEVAGDLFVVDQDHVWKSLDEGMTWSKVIFNTPFEERKGYGMVNIDRQLILFGGRNPDTKKYLNDVWMSQY
ncbi:MAG: Kelch repeat-containing protein [Brevinema sp.]